MHAIYHTMDDSSLLATTDNERSSSEQSHRVRFFHAKSCIRSCSKVALGTFILIIAKFSSLANSVALLTFTTIITIILNIAFIPRIPIITHHSTIPIVSYLVFHSFRKTTDTAISIYIRTQSTTHTAKQARKFIKIAMLPTYLLGLYLINQYQHRSGDSHIMQQYILLLALQLLLDTLFFALLWLIVLISAILLIPSKYLANIPLYNAHQIINQIKKNTNNNPPLNVLLPKQQQPVNPQKKPLYYKSHYPPPANPIAAAASATTTGIDFSTTGSSFVSSTSSSNEVYPFSLGAQAVVLASTGAAETEMSSPLDDDTTAKTPLFSALAQSIYHNSSNGVDFDQLIGYEQKGTGGGTAAGRSSKVRRLSLLEGGSIRSVFEGFQQGREQQRQPVVDIENECLLCGDGLGRDGKEVILPCSNEEAQHAFHEECIARWLQGNLSCPYCGQNVLVHG